MRRCIAELSRTGSSDAAARRRARPRFAPGMRHLRRRPGAAHRATGARATGLRPSSLDDAQRVQAGQFEDPSVPGGQASAGLQHNPSDRLCRVRTMACTPELPRLPLARSIIRRSGLLPTRPSRSSDTPRSATATDSGPADEPHSVAAAASADAAGVGDDRCHTRTVRANKRRLAILTHTHGRAQK